ncbi:hypothetical protein FB2170_00140 [Maribacter sp. HTCC2170]|nr:hypothetical protein FB2170_00140 [Maribacter sp. HTCC2170]
MRSIKKSVRGLPKTSNHPLKIENNYEIHQIKWFPFRTDLSPFKTDLPYSLEIVLHMI